MANARGGSPNGEAHRAAQRERILQAAEQLLVTHGVERSRLRDVSLAAGVSIGTVQHYFDTRDRLVAELFDWSSERRLETWLLAASTAGDPWTRLVSLLDASLAEPLLFRSRIWVEFCAMARDDELRAKLDRFYEELMKGEWGLGITGDLTYDGPPPFEQGVTHYATNGHLALIRQFAFEVLSTAEKFDWRNANA